MASIDPTILFFLILCIIAACAFEFINGFHDTANAVATVIYTKSLKPTTAVVWSGIWNFLGVYLGGITVAMGIVNLIPPSLYLDQNVYQAIAMILSLMLTAIAWNLGTWYLGLPCSSSHTMLGSIFGVGIAFMFVPHTGDVLLNWGKVKDVLLFLLISPIIGFALTLLLMRLAKKTIKNKRIFEESDDKKNPPLWIRGILVLTCTGVSFAHGSNDGQKGVGLIMIILFCLLPFKYAVNHELKPNDLITKADTIQYYVNKVEQVNYNDELCNCKKITNSITQVKEIVGNAVVFDSIAPEKHAHLRAVLVSLTKESEKIYKFKGPYAKLNLTAEEKDHFQSEVNGLKAYTEYSIWWVLLIVSFSLGLGTMIGWKRIVVTIGEKIGKSHLTYAQGASSELVTATTIGLSTLIGAPVSTTHVLSSGVAGSMVANKGLKNLRMGTIRSILIAWLITLPVTVLMSGLLFLLLRWILV